MLVVRDYLAPLARHVPLVDRVLVLPRVRGVTGGMGMLRALSAIVGLKPDLAFVLNSVSRSRTADLVAALSGARLIVGRSRVGAGPLLARAGGEGDSHSDSYNLSRDPLYDLDCAFGSGSEHQVDRLLDLVRWTGAASRSRAMVFALTPEERKAGEETLRGGAPTATAPAPAKRIGIHPAAANALKCWPVESFVELGVALTAATPVQFLVLDTPKEPGPARALFEGLSARAVPAVLVAALPLAEFAAVLAPLDLVVCNDSGVMHLAAALGVPTLSIHSLGHPAEWAPRNEKAIALQGEPIARVSVAAALDAARRLLAP